MRVKTSQLVRRAVMLLDEDLEELELAQTYGDPGMEIRRLASELVEEAVTKTLREATPEAIDETMTLDTDHARTAREGWLEVDLPDDWLRPVEIRMEGWPKPLHDYRDPQPVTRGLTLPGAGVIRRDGRRVLRVSSSGAVNRKLHVEYLPRPDASGATVWIPRGLVNDAARHLADMVRDVVTG